MQVQASVRPSSPNDRNPRKREAERGWTRGNPAGPDGLNFTWKLKMAGTRFDRVQVPAAAEPADPPAAVEAKERPLLPQSTTSRCIASPRHGTTGSFDYPAPSAAACSCVISEHETARHAGCLCLRFGFVSLSCHPTPPLVPPAIDPLNVV